MVGGAGPGFFSGRGLAIRATLPAPAPLRHGSTLASVATPVNLAVSDAARGHLWIKRSPPSSVASSMTVACRMTASQLSGGGPSDGAPCDACGLVLAKEQLLMERTWLAGGLPIQFHVRCFQIWDEERRTPRARTA